MKGAIFAVCLCIAIFFIDSCKKNSSVQADLNATITGNWELSGYLSMRGTISIAGGSGNRWKFTGTKFYQYINDTLADKGTYAIIKDSSMQNVVMGGELNLYGYTTRHYTFYLKNYSTLAVDFGSAFDAPVYIYIKR